MWFYEWSASSGDWSNAGNWGWLYQGGPPNPTNPPGLGDQTYINNQGTAIITQPGETCGLLIILSSGLQITGGGLTAAQECISGNPGAASIAQSSGTNSAQGPLWVGDYDGSGSGKYYLSGSAALSANGEWMGSGTVYSGNCTGVFNQSGGVNNSGSILVLALDTGDSGTYILSSGSLSVSGNLLVGNGGSGTFTQSGGTNSVSGAVELGSLAGGGGTYNLNGGLLVLSQMSQGPGTAAFNFSGGTLQAGSGLSTSLPMTLGTTGGGATFNTAGYSLTVSGRFPVSAA